MRRPGIEPGSHRWQRWILPLDHLRLMKYSMNNVQHKSLLTDGSNIKENIYVSVRYGIVVRTSGSHPLDPGSIPGTGSFFFVCFSHQIKNFLKKAQPAGFEPARAEHTSLAGKRLNHSAKVADIKQNLGDSIFITYLIAACKK